MEIGSTTAPKIKTNFIYDFIIVANVNNCPIHYIPIINTHDTGVNACTVVSGLFKNTTRCICIKRSKSETVLTSIIISEEKQHYGYKHLATTQDTIEKVFKKKQIYLRYDFIDHAKNAVTDVILLSNKIDIPLGYYTAGLIGNFYLCYKMDAYVEQKSVEFLDLSDWVNVDNPKCLDTKKRTYNTLSTNSVKKVSER
ncbi:hypothetical protein A3Q56_03046, partial [Intoshia linei]